MKTEAEARKTWCPHVRAAMAWQETLMYEGGQGGMPLAATVNRGNHLSAETTCIASACSQWVEHTAPRREFLPARSTDGRPAKAGMAEPDRPDHLPEDWIWEPGNSRRTPGWHEPEASARERAEGFCGRNVGEAIRVYGYVVGSNEI